MINKIKKKLLIVDDEMSSRESLRMVFNDMYDIVMAGNGEDAIICLKEKDFDLVMLDIVMPGMSGLDTLAKIKQTQRSLPVIILTATRMVDTAVNAMKAGAYDYIIKPFNIEELKLVVKKSLKDKELYEEVKHLRSEVKRSYRIEDIIGTSRDVKDVNTLIKQAAQTKATILIHGESGTGKELVAKAIHYHSPRTNKPFIAINCAAIPDTLIESELFGHEKGAFTDAFRQRPGKFELAHEGTLFLDEIGELSVMTQAKILRVLQEKEFTRVGGSDNISVDIRLVTATNKDLQKEVNENRFRADLFYRINVVPIFIPPLRMRKNDIPLLAEHFLEKISSEEHKEKKIISPEAMEIMKSYHWPGNIRELENAMERLATICPDNVIKAGDLPHEFKMENSDAIINQELTASTFKDAKEKFEKQYFIELLNKHNGNISHAAQEADMDRKNFFLKLKKFNLDKTEFM
ncbi:MAG: sigma-54 dependent transcriptional regulator [bacterium]|nr:sigma-54 dependent transcriptional regulator [bacterium]